MLSEELVALRRCDRNGHHIADIGERCPLGRGKAQMDVEDDFPRHDEVMVERKGVKCEVDHALDRVFDRYETQSTSPEETASSTSGTVRIGTSSPSERSR